MTYQQQKRWESKRGVDAGKMRHKWEEVKGDPEYVKETAKFTIREDIFNNMLAYSLKAEDEANRLKNQVEIEKKKQH